MVCGEPLCSPGLGLGLSSLSFHSRGPPGRSRCCAQRGLPGPCLATLSAFAVWWVSCSVSALRAPGPGCAPGHEAPACNLPGDFKPPENPRCLAFASPIPWTHFRALLSVRPSHPLRTRRPPSAPPSAEQRLLPRQQHKGPFMPRPLPPPPLPPAAPTRALATGAGHLGTGSRLCTTCTLLACSGPGGGTGPQSSGNGSVISVWLSQALEVTQASFLSPFPLPLCPSSPAA